MLLTGSHPGREDTTPPPSGTAATTHPQLAPRTKAGTDADNRHPAGGIDCACRLLGGWIGAAAAYLVLAVAGAKAKSYGARRRIGMQRLTGGMPSFRSGCPPSSPAVLSRHLGTAASLQVLIAPSSPPWHSPCCSCTYPP